MKKLTMMAVLVAVSVPVFAQTVGSETQRAIKQQQRIESGLQSGQLSTVEAGKLERQESRIDKVQSNALKNGNLSPAEKAKINRMQNKASSEIAADKHNGVTGNPNSVSSQRMQADVQRNVNQERRIDNGIKSGALSKQQVGKLQGGEARVDHVEAKAARNGHVNAKEQRRVKHAQGRMSGRIHHAKVTG